MLFSPTRSQEEKPLPPPPYRRSSDSSIPEACGCSDHAVLPPPPNRRESHRRGPSLCGEGNRATVQRGSIYVHTTVSVPGAYIAPCSPYVELPVFVGTGASSPRAETQTHRTSSSISVALQRVRRSVTYSKKPFVPKIHPLQITLIIECTCVPGSNGHPRELAREMGTAGLQCFRYSRDSQGGFLTGRSEPCGRASVADHTTVLLDCRFISFR